MTVPQFSLDGSGGVLNRRVFRGLLGCINEILCRLPQHLHHSANLSVIVEMSGEVYSVHRARLNTGSTRNSVTRSGRDNAATGFRVKVIGGSGPLYRVANAIRPVDLADPFLTSLIVGSRLMPCGRRFSLVSGGSRETTWHSLFSHFTGRLSERRFGLLRSDDFKLVCLIGLLRRRQVLDLQLALEAILDLLQLLTLRTGVVDQFGVRRTGQVGFGRLRGAILIELLRLRQTGLGVSLDGLKLLRSCQRNVAHRLRQTGLRERASRMRRTVEGFTFRQRNEIARNARCQRSIADRMKDRHGSTRNI